MWSPAYWTENAWHDQFWRDSADLSVLRFDLTLEIKSKMRLLSGQLMWVWFDADQQLEKIHK